MFVGNLLRFTGIGYAALFFIEGYGLPGLAWGAVLGELTSFFGLLCSRLLRESFPLAQSLVSLVILCLAYVFALVCNAYIPPIIESGTGFVLGAGLLVTGLFWMTRKSNALLDGS